VLKNAEIDNFRFHNLRHTFATRLAQKEIDIYMIAKLLGRENIRITQRYSHHSPESLRVGVDNLPSMVRSHSLCDIA
jgi:integrase